MKLSKSGLIGLSIGVLGMLIGIVAAILAGGLPGLIMSIIFLFVFGSLFWKMFFKPMMVRRKLEKGGVSASAKILELSDTGVTVNNDPQVKLLLEVSPPMGSTYLVETKQLISRLQIPMIQPGTIIPVLIDLNDKNLISIDYSGGSSAAQTTDVSSVPTGPWTGISKEEAGKKLAENEEKNNKLLSSGKSSRAIVIKYTWLGIYVNGQNPAVQLELEILPDDRPAFKGTAIGVIKDTSVPKFQVGEEIFIKYNPENPSEVTIEHS